MSLDLKILQALKEDETKEHDVREKLRITKGAYEKAMLYAKVVSRLAGGGMECYGYLLKPKDRLDDLVTDVYFAHEQDATSAHVRVEAEGVRKAVDEVYPLGYEIVGWWHSHGSFSTFHSGTDVENFETVLHSIAPRTMFKNEKTISVLKDGELEFDDYVVKGVSGDSIKVIKRVKRDPFAFSFVVNERGENYRECITKTYNPESKGFSLNTPSHPAVERVDYQNDVRFSVREIEKDVILKLRFFGAGDEDKVNEYPSYAQQIRKFIDSAKNYLYRGGKHTLFVCDLLANSFDSSYETLKNSKEAQASEKTKTEVLDEIFARKNDIVHKIDLDLNNTNPQIFLNPNNKFTKSELEKLILFQFVLEFVRKDEWSSAYRSREQDAIVDKYRKRANLLEHCSQIASKAADSLADYAMQSFSRYKGEQKNKYENLVTNILYNISDTTNLAFIDSVKNEVKKTGQRKYIFLGEDRENIANQLTKDLYYSEIGKCNSQFTGEMYNLLKEFPEAYSKGTADALIEKYLVPMGNVDKSKLDEIKDNSKMQFAQKDESKSHSISYMIRKRVSDLFKRRGL